MVFFVRQLAESVHGTNTYSIKYFGQRKNDNIVLDIIVLIFDWGLSNISC